MVNNKCYFIVAIVSFIFGVSMGGFYFTDYDLLSKYQRVEVKLTQDLVVENLLKQKLIIPKDTILYHVNSYEQQDYLTLNIIVEGVSKVSQPVGNRKEKSKYFWIEAR